MVLKISRSSCIALLILLIFEAGSSFAQVGIGTSSPAASAKLDVSSTTQGLLIPRMTQAQRTAISSPAEGLMVYQTDGTKGLYDYDGTSWGIAGVESTLYSTDGTLSGNRTVSAGGYTLTFLPKTTFSPSVTATAAYAVGTQFSPTLTAAANNDVLVGIKINPTFSNSSGYTGVATYGLQVEGINIGRGGGSVSTNLAIGDNALKNNTVANKNTIIGNSSGSAITTGSINTIVGAQNFSTATSGSNNCVLGGLNMPAATTGIGNIAIGTQVLNGLTTGTYNIAMGNQPAYFLTTGNHNVSIGQLSLFYSNSDHNIGIGYRAGFNITSGTSNTCIGNSADVNDGTYTNSTALGNGAKATASNAIQLGNSSITLLRSQVSLTVASDRRLKENIKDTRYGLKEVMKLRTVDYVMTTNQLQQVGFIAQEVQTLVPEVVTGKEGDLSKGDILGITYEKLVPILTKAIQEQQAMIEQLKKQVEALKRRR